MNAIETRDLTKRFKDKTAVDGLNLTVAENEFFALLGTNGAGKTTTIKMLCCLSRPTSGEALIMGKSVTAQSEQVKELINISPQETAVGVNLTVRENLELSAGLYGNSRARSREMAADMITRMRLGEVEKSRAKTLSGGWMRRLSIAMALISAPKVLFLDEPTLGLDVFARRELWGVIRALRGHATVVLTTHYLEEAEALSDRIGVMARGRLAALGTPDELKKQTGCDTFEDAFIALAGEGAEKHE